MEVYALVGPSGTGKSHRAGIIAHNHNIPLIIDDGLLIWDGKILAGRSAKREHSKLAAIRTALFYDQAQVEEVKEGIRLANEDSILLLGTSVKMVERIIENLSLPTIERLIHITEVASKEEIKQAQAIRRKEGKHVIPVPTIEVKSQFPGYLLNPLELFFNKGKQTIKKEKTIVRPKFSFYGNLFIYNKVINDLVYHYISCKKNDIQLRNVKIDENKDCLKIGLSLILNYGLSIPEYIKDLQLSLKKLIENFTGIEVLNISVDIVSLLVDNE